MNLKDLMTFIDSIDADTYPELLELPVYAGTIEDIFNDAPSVKNISIFRSSVRDANDGIYIKTE